MTQAPALHLSGRAAIGDQTIFEGLELTIPAGAWTCLLGSSGVGKSTVLRLFAGLAEQVQFEGVMTPDEAALKGQVALMAQDDLLMPWLSALENVMLGARLRGDDLEQDRAMDVLGRVGLTDKAAQKPSELSGGQKQRVALARTLMEDRPIVLLDEPFSALDVQTRAQMQELACELLDTRTVLLVTHDPAEAARLGHQIVLMTQSQAQVVTPPHQPTPRLVSDPDVLRAQSELFEMLNASTVTE